MHAGNSLLLKTVDPFRWWLHNKRVLRFLSSYLTFFSVISSSIHWNILNTSSSIHLISPSFSSNTHYFLFQSFTPVHFVEQSVWTGRHPSSPYPLWAFPPPQLLALVSGALISRTQSSDVCGSTPHATLTSSSDPLSFKKRTKRCQGGRGAHPGGPWGPMARKLGSQRAEVPHIRRLAM